MKYDRLKIDYQGLLEFKTAVTEEQRVLRRKLEETEMVGLLSTNNC